jgi:hypothetical protein
MEVTMSDTLSAVMCARERCNDRATQVVTTLVGHDASQPSVPGNGHLEHHRLCLRHATEVADLATHGRLPRVELVTVIAVVGPRLRVGNEADREDALRRFRDSRGTR